MQEILALFPLGGTPPTQPQNLISGAKFCFSHDINLQAMKRTKPCLLKISTCTYHVNGYSSTLVSPSASCIIISVYKKTYKYRDIIQ